MMRTARIEGDVAYIPLTQGYEAIIDAEDVPLVAGFNWHAKVQRRAGGGMNVYAARNATASDGSRSIVLMHRVIAGTPDGLETDHEDGNGLNNRRNNMRDATGTENQQNARLRSDSTTKIKGVVFEKHAGKFSARIRVNGYRRRLGLFESINDAARAYDAAAVSAYGEFARLNCMEGQ